jgi:hypothetical protein
MIYYYFIIIILIFLFIIIYKNKIENFKNNDIIRKEGQKEYTFNTYTSLLLNNNKKNIFKKKLNKNLERRRKDCLSTCSAADCLKMDQMTKLLKKCVKCNKQKNKTFKKSVIGGTCDDYDGNSEKLDCNDVMNFGCINPNDMDSKNGVLPYYIQINDNNLNSPFNKKCAFCWQLNDLI